MISRLGEQVDAVFPAHAGVSLTLALRTDRALRFPRTRGGEPGLGAMLRRCHPFSPHTRG